MSQSSNGLPGAVRPEETEDLAVTDLEGDVLERDPVTEPLAQTADGQRRGAPLPAGSRRPRRGHEAVAVRGPRARRARTPRPAPRPGTQCGASASGGAT